MSLNSGMQAAIPFTAEIQFEPLSWPSRKVRNYNYSEPSFHALAGAVDMRDLGWLLIRHTSALREKTRGFGLLFRSIAQAIKVGKRDLTDERLL